MHTGEILGDWVTLEGQFSIPFVLLSIAFAIIGAYTAIVMHDRIIHSSFLPRWAWLLLESFALAFGICAMHYMGMFAYELPIGVEFDLLLAISSFFPVLFTSYITFYLGFKYPRSLPIAIGSSFIFAIGVMMMHLIGMRSMVSIAHHQYDLPYLLAAFLIVIISYTIFQRVRIYLKKPIAKFGFALFTGINLAIMHYLAMFGMKLIVPKDTALLTSAVPMSFRMEAVIILTGVFLLILIFLLVMGFVDKHVHHRAENFDMLTKLPNIRMFEQSLEEDLYGKIGIIQVKGFHGKFKKSSYIDREKIIKRIVEQVAPYKSKDSQWFRTDYYQFVLLTSSQDSRFISSLQTVASKLRERYEVRTGELVDVKFKIVYYETQDQKKLNAMFEEIKIHMEKLPFNNEMMNFEDIIRNKTVEDELIERIPRAMQENELFLVYQPKLDMNTNTFCNVEALIRWNHPDRGFISPCLFIPPLEKNPLIFDVTDWIIEKVCQQLVNWNEQNIGINIVSINIPGIYIGHDRLKNTLIKITQKYGIHPNQIELEITETSYVDNIEKAIKCVKQYRTLGFLVAIDDFGTGVSSLSYLKELDISTLKIDKSFIDGVPSVPKDSSILTGIISLANSLRLNVVIEGVETKEQVDYLKEHFKDALIQGYYFSKPILPEEISTFYSETKSNALKRISVDI